MIRSVFKYQDKEIEKAFDALIDNLKKIKKRSEENAKKIEDFNKVLRAMLEREKMEYVLDKEDNYQTRKREKLYCKYFDIKQIKSEVEK